MVSSNNSGVWATDTDGGLHMIAREGYPFDVSNDPLNPDVRTVFDVDLAIGSGGQDGRRASLNDNGQLAFWIEFEDFSEGVFVATLAALPPCPADLNDDGSVNGTDLGLLLGAWGTNNPAADLNASGNVDGTDLGLLLGAWGACP